MNQSCKYFGRSFIPYRQATKILKSGVRSLYDPSVPVPAKFAFILMSRNLVFIPRRNNRLNTATDQQSPKFIAVIGSVCNEPLRFALFTLPYFYLDAVKRRLCQRHFRGGSLLHVYSERSTRAIGQYHELCSLATFCLPDQWAPFFARTNIPSIKHSSQRTFCWSESWLRKARHRFRRTPVSAQVLRRRWTVLFEPYISGNSLHGAPVQSIQRMPSKHFRSSTGERPPFRFRRDLGKYCWINSHCLSVNARQAIQRHLLGLVAYGFKTNCQPVLG